VTTLKGKTIASGVAGAAAPCALCPAPACPTSSCEKKLYMPSQPFPSIVAA